MKQKKLKILFRISGGKAPKKELGLGHVFRCINLAKILRKHDLFFLVEDYGEKVVKTLKKNGFKKVTYRYKNLSLEKDIKETINQIIKNKIDLVIVDKYKTKIRYLKEIRKLSKTVLITDLSNIDYPVDLVVNGFVGFENKVSTNKYGSRCLLGPKFQILNQQFIKKRKTVRKKYDLLVTFGGFDEKKITSLLLETLEKYSKQVKVKIILGPATQKTRKMRVLGEDGNRNLTIIDETKNMFKEMINSRYGLCSGGITTYEFASLKIPFAIICQVKHQLITAKEWEKKGFGRNLGLANKETGKKIVRFLEEIIDEDNLSIPKTRLVDGLGSKRVSNELLKL